METDYTRKLLRDRSFLDQANIYTPSLPFGSGYEWAHPVLGLVCQTRLTDLVGRQLSVVAGGLTRLIQA